MVTSNLTDVFKEERDKLISEIDGLRSQLFRKEEKLKAYNILIDDDSDSEQQIPTTEADTKSDEYPNPGSYPDKILFVLKQVGEALAKDISEYVIKKEGIVDEDQKKSVFGNVTLQASRLYRANKIDASQVGKSYKYKLKN